MFLLGTAACVGFMIPGSESFLRPYEAALSALFAVLSWNLFHLIVPARYFYRLKWMRFQILAVPLLWIALVAILSMLLSHLLRVEKEKLDDFFVQVC